MRTRRWRGRVAGAGKSSSARRMAISAAAMWTCAAAAIAFAQEPTPSHWIDVSDTPFELASLASIARRAVSHDEVWIGYAFAVRNDVRIDCDSARGYDFIVGSDGNQFRFDRREEISEQRADRRVRRCEENVGLFLRFNDDTSAVAEARLLPIRRAAERLSEPVVWAGEVAADDSVDYLRAAVLGVRGPISSASTKTRVDLLAAVAVHDSEASIEVVLSALEGSQAADLRRSAVFWVSRVGTDAGSQTLLQLARNDADEEVRKEAIFWLGQVAGERATEDLAAIAEDDPSTAVQQSAVFALSQNADDAAIDTLIRIARSHDNREVVRSTLFWLGQSGDERAVELFEQLIFGRR